MHIRIGKTPNVFYGWWIVVACFVLGLYAAGIVFYGFTAIFEPIADEFGWSYTQISLAASLRVMEIGLLCPLVGFLVDRWGPRRPIIGGTILLCLGFMLLSQTTSLGTFYGAFALIALGSSTFSMTVLATAVANWFWRRIGIAAGIMMCGYGFSGLLVPIMTRLINVYEWRTAMVILGLGMLVVGLPMSLLVRHRPEQYGYLLDGDTNSSVILDEGLASVQTAERDISVKQALKSRAFWHMAMSLISQQMILMAVVTHVMPYLSSIGIARATSSLVAGAIPLVSIGGRLGSGWLGDRLDKRYVTAGGFALISLGMLFFSYTAGEMWLLLPSLALFGLGYGGNNTMRAALPREYFGRGNFGTILGCLMGIGAMGNVAGAPLAGWVFDNYGSYQPIWLAFTGFAAAAAVIIATTPPVSTATQPPRWPMSK